MKTGTEITLFNQEKIELMKHINFDNDMISLTDLWKQAGSPDFKKPSHWLRLEVTKDLVSAVGSVGQYVGKALWSTRRGGTNPGTYAHKSIALAYAKYLDAKLHVLVNEIFFQRVEEEKNPDLIVDRAVSTYKRRGKSDIWIQKRISGKLKRNSFTSCLANHGVDTPKGFKKCTNAIYEPLYGGGASLVREKKSLPDNVNIRDNMSELELSAVEFAESLSRDNIKRKGVYGENSCATECHSSARIIANAIVESRKLNSAF